MYLIYTRRSTDDPNNQKNSLEFQLQQSQKYADTQKIELTSDTVEGVMENGVIAERHSAYKSNSLSVSVAGLVEYQIERPKFMQMISWLLEGKYKGVVVLCYDRISRNEQDDIVIKNLLREHGICIKFVNVEYDHKTSAGALHMDIDAMFARHWSRVSSEKITGAMRKQRKAGLYPHRTVVGYLDEGADKKPIDEERAPIVIRCFELYDTGDYSLQQLHKWAVEEEKLTLKPQRPRRTKEERLAGIEKEPISTPPTQSYMQKMLRNRFYLGEVYDKDESEWIQGIHEPLIDAELFWRVQERLSANNVSSVLPSKPYFAFRGMVQCQCGRAYSPYRSKKNGEVYYGCKCKSDCGQSGSTRSRRRIRVPVDGAA